MSEAEDMGWTKEEYLHDLAMLDQASPDVRFVKNWIIEQMDILDSSSVYGLMREMRDSGCLPKQVIAAAAFIGLHGALTKTLATTGESLGMGTGEPE